MKTKSVQQRRDQHRRNSVDQHRRVRANRKAQSVNRLNTPEQRLTAKQQLQMRDRNTSQVRVVNRCVETGRARSVIRMFRRSRYIVRDRIRQGQLPGFTKAS
jgi:small subunit ribosomal protein S14